LKLYSFLVFRRIILISSASFQVKSIVFFIFSLKSAVFPLRHRANTVFFKTTLEGVFLRQFNCPLDLLPEQ